MNKKDTETAVELEKLDLRSHEIAADKAAELLRLFPEIRTEGGKIDFDRLKRVLGETADPGKERYGMNWPGKADCFKTIQQPSLATLRPCPEESVNFDTSENLFIEGDNLEVLKLLQKSYIGKIKMIYIDPPYNTGNDFIYPDNYAESLQTYLEYTEQVDDQGKKFSTNTDTDGRFHSKWLNMMYPRLYLARNLLRDDGVIFVSIDDNEASNLKVLMDDIFGPENHLVTHYVQVRYGSKTLAEKNDYQKLIEQVIVYQKASHQPIKKTEDYSLDKFCWEINEKKPGIKTEIGGKQVEIFPDGYYEITRVNSSIKALKETWATGTVLIANASGKYFGTHLAPRKEIDGLGALYKVLGIGEDGLGFRYFTGPKKESATKGKFFSGVPLSRVEELNAGESLKSQPIPNFYEFAGSFGNCRHEGDTDFRSGKKPIAFISEWINQAVKMDESAIILDFFAGSSSTGHAVFSLNKEDGGNRKFILVQLPEPCNEKSEAVKENYKTISDLGKERLRRAIRQVQSENQHTQEQQLLLDTNLPDVASSANTLDLGFRVFRLAESNFKPWQAEIPNGDTEVLSKQLEFHVSHIRENRTPEDILYEILLKSGFPLPTQVEKIIVCGKSVYGIADGAMLICLDDALTHDLIKAIADRKPERVICLDEGFAGNDQLKTNAVQTMKARGVTSFKTV